MHDRTRTTLWAALAALAAVATAPSSVRAQDDQTVAVAPFTGEGRLARLAEQAHDESVKSIADWFKTVPDADYAQAVAAVGEDGTEAERFARIAGTVGALVVLTGALTEAEDRSMTLALVVRSARDGAVLGSIDLDVPRRINREMRETLGTEVPKLILMALAADKDRLEKAEAERKRQEEEKARLAKEAEEQAKREAEEKARLEQEQKEQKAREEAERKRREKLALRGSAKVGLALTGRNLAFNADEAAGEPYSYDGATTSSVMLAGEVFPLGLTGIEPLANLGFAVHFDRTLALKTEFQDQEFATAQTRWGLGLRYLFPLGESVDTAPTIEAALGVSGTSHTIDSGAMVLVPDVSYTFIDIGAGVRMPITPKLGGQALARYLVVLSSGAIAEPENYGGTSAMGLDFEASAYFMVMPKVKVSAGFQFTRMSLTFDGDGTLSMDGAGNQYVRGGNDTYLGGYLAAGYTF